MNSCACVYIDHDSEAEFHTESIRRARKEHKCTECDVTIQPGQIYEYVFGIWDGCKQVYKTCNDCLTVRKEFFCSMFFYGRIWEDMWEHVFGGTVGDSVANCLKDLTPRAREMVCELIENIWEEEDDE